MFLAAGTVLFSIPFHFEVEALRGTLFSEARWESLGRRIDHSSWPIIAASLTLVFNLSALPLGRWRGRSWQAAMLGVALANLPWLILWLYVLLVYWLEGYANEGDGSGPIAFALLVADTPLFVSVALGGWFAGLWQTAFPPRESPSMRIAVGMLAIVTIGYAIGFSVLSILQYNALHVPHGDTAMYEEHLWNALHGKGFRSQLDGGRLFFGEHFQSIHLLLTPIYLLYPSLKTLNVCQSVALASGAIAIFLLVRQLGLSVTVAWLLGFAYLIYFPLQHLNLEASWKTFRPTSFSVPLVLFATLALEKDRLWTMLILLAFAILGGEEYAIVAASLGIYVACRRPRGPWGRKEILFGLGMTMGAVAFLLFALVIFIPYFRGGVPHYTPYFEGLGDSPVEIFRSLMQDPAEIGRRLSSREDLQFLLLMLVPLALLPLASPGRFCVALPIFGYLMLADREGLVQPWFHFHGPLIPLLFWSMAGGIKNLSRWLPAELLARLAVSIGLVSCFWYGRAALSWKFYDPVDSVPWKMTADGPLFEPRGSYWKSVYWPQERAKAFPLVDSLLDPSVRIAVTDYLRPRYTHFQAAHDYPIRPHVPIEEIDAILLDKTEGWWGRDENNPDKELMACFRSPRCQPGTRLTVRGKPFIVAYHDPYFLLVRRLPSE
jgi:uncharacterized membrane protein